MAKIESRPPREHLLGAPRLLRAPEKGNLTGIITSARQAGSRTHHYQGRTECCQHDDCKMCMAGVRKEYHGYLACWDSHSLEHYVIELTPAPSDLVADWEEKYGTLRGCHFKLFRAIEKKNGRVRIQLKERPAHREKLPPAIDLTAYLERLWGVVFESAHRVPERSGTTEIIMASSEEAMTIRERALANGPGHTAAG